MFMEYYDQERFGGQHLKTPGSSIYTSVTLAEVKAQYKLPISLGRRPALTINDVKIITEDYLKAVVAYFEHIKEKPDLYKKNPMEYRNKSPNELVMVRTLTDEIVGIKYNRDEDIPSNSEYERALHEASEAKTMLKMKALLENGHCKPDEDLSLFETNLDITESQIEEAMELSLIESKKAKLQWLKIENRLAELDTEVKKQLGLDKANPSEAAKLLGEILKLDIEPLMLIKHPSVFDMARRLRRYVGNVSEWNYTEDECLKFDLLAERVRDTAGAVYTKFVELFKQTDEDNGYHQYLEQNNRFREQVTDMAECNVFALTAAPLSRVAFFDSMEDKEELKILVDKLGKNKMSSTVHLQV